MLSARCSLILGSDVVFNLFQGIYGNYVVSCAGIIGIKYRHNMVRNTHVDICSQSGILARKKVDIGLSGERDKPLCSADVLLYS